MPSQYMPYRPGDLLKATDVNTLLASVPFYTNSGSMGVGTNSVMVQPIENAVWINVTESIAAGKLKQDDVHPYGVIYGVPRHRKGNTDTDEAAGQEGQASFGNWVFYNKRQKSDQCQAFYTLTGVMSPVAVANVVPATGDSGGGNDDGSGGGGASGGTTQTSQLGDIETQFDRNFKQDPELMEKLISYQQCMSLDSTGQPTAGSVATDNLSGQLFVGVIVMVPGERYVLDVQNNFDDDAVAPGEEYVYDAETHKLKKVKSGSSESSDMVVHRRRYHPKTKPYSPGMDPRFAPGDDLIWCGGEGYFSGHVGNPLDPPEGFEIGPIYRVEYGGEVFVGKFSLKDSSFWNIATGYIVPGWVDRFTGLSVFHPSASSSDDLFSAPGTAEPLLGDEPNPTGSSDGSQDAGVTEITLGSGFAKYAEEFQNSCLAEIVYTPISTAEVVEKVEESNLGTVRLPISSVLIQAMAVPPRMDAPLDPHGHTLFDRVAETDSEDDSNDTGGQDNGTGDNDEQEQEHSGTVSFPDFEKEGSKAVAYSFLVAKTLGLVEPAGSVPSYQQAYYSAEDTTRPFCKKVSIDKTSGSVPVGRFKEAVEESGWSNIDIKDHRLFKEGEAGEQDEYICFGTYEPTELRTSEPVYFDMLSSSNRLYIQRVEADHVKNNSYARYVPLLKKDSKSDTCGWIRYRYYDEAESNQKPETVKLSVPSVLGSSVSVSDNSWKVNGETYDPVMFTPFWSEYGMGYGYAETQSVDATTKEATILYYPYRASQSSSAPKYDQYHSFPFFFDGLSLPKRARLTTKKYKAQRSDWVPAICTTLDHNEVLIPGMVVPIEETNTTINGQTFRYLTVTPPESYSTSLEGTPNEVVYKISYQAPSPSDIEESIIKEDDCWVTGIKKLDDDEAIPPNPPTGTVYRVGIKLKSDTGAPDIAEAFGAFNNCDNRGSMTVFLRTTAWGINYTCTARLDHIPFGYAVPSKTPSCYYKSGNDPCAASMVSQRFLVKRIEADNRLYLTGACYVPCSTLTSFN